jgi:hypothetical protein
MIFAGEVKTDKIVELDVYDSKKNVKAMIYSETPRYIRVANYNYTMYSESASP